ncbi:hypothetical protein [Thermofilum pendens]|uniref:hypothetical protein n=1 Tax=Thermofilum pendens TaxID=2269 RepID=UPI000A5C282B|nr:hypothetical protein [Thermofilum pendens]
MDKVLYGFLLLVAILLLSSLLTAPRSIPAETPTLELSPMGELQKTGSQPLQPTAKTTNATRAYFTLKPGG